MGPPLYISVAVRVEVGLVSDLCMRTESPAGCFHQNDINSCLSKLPDNHHNINLKKSVQANEHASIVMLRFPHQ